ncbi:hypothetical protein [Myxosarcina sp. GI1]|nr:hypothetical protein [Myxosarcina sp. GI1]
MSENFWSNYRIRVEPWATEYDSPINLTNLECTQPERIDLTVETHEWTAI